MVIISPEWWMSFTVYSDFNEVAVPWRAQIKFEVTTRRCQGSQDRTIMKMPSFEMGKHGLHVERGRTHIAYTGSRVVEINGGWCCFEQVPGCACGNPEHKHEQEHTRSPTTWVRGLFSCGFCPPCMVAAWAFKDQSQDHMVHSRGS